MKSFELLLLVGFIFIFFARLFFPPSLFVTPDFGRSDSLHSNLPAKIYLAENIKSGHFPLWSGNVGQGFPLTAEGIVAAYYIPNLLLSILVPLKFLVPTTYMVTFLTSALGMYLLTFSLTKNKISGAVAALSYTFCASMMLHVQHFNFIQAASLVPLVFYLSIKFKDESTLKNALLLTLVLSQFLLTGFVQIFVYTLLLLIIFVTLDSFLNKKGLFKKPVLFLALTILAVVISAVQILPSAELNSRSQRAEGFDAKYILTSFPMSPANLLRLTNPFIQGSAKDGTANSLDWERDGIFWESTAYIGILPLALALFSLSFLLKPKRRENYYIIILVLALLSILLALGKYSPLHITFSLPPLNLFRVPARFLLLTQFFLAILAGYGTKRLLDLLQTNTRRLIYFAIPILICTDLLATWWSYNPIGTYDAWVAPPEVAKFIQSRDATARVFTIGGMQQWNSVFTKSGWSENLETFDFLRNSLDANSNISYDINHFSMFETLPTRRYTLLNYLIYQDIKVEPNQIILGDTAKSLLDSGNVKYVVSTKEVQSDRLSKIFETERGDMKYILYESLDAAPSAKLFYESESVKNQGDYENIFANLDLDKIAVVEKSLDLSSESVDHSLEVLRSDVEHIRFKVETNRDALLVVSNTFYPGWRAKVDNTETEIMPANLNHQGVEVPAGTHIVELDYKPNTFSFGLLITVASYSALLLTVIYKGRQKR